MTILALLAASTALAAADDKTPIKPFGSVEWNDSFGAVVAKYNSMPGIKKCTLRAGRYEVACDGAKSAAQGTAALLALIKKAAMGTNPKARAEEFDANFAKRFEGKDGKELRAFEHSIAAEFDSVVIEGIEFKIEASFEACPGFVITDPTRVLSVGGKPAVVEPLILDQVELHAQGHEEQSAKRAIIEKLEEKYGNIRDRNHAANEDEPYSVEWSNKAHGPQYRRRDGECQKADDKLEELKAKRSTGGKTDSGKF